MARMDFRARVPEYGVRGPLGYFFRISRQRLVCSQISSGPCYTATCFTVPQGPGGKIRLRRTYPQSFWQFAIWTAVNISGKCRGHGPIFTAKIASNRKVEEHRESICGLLGTGGGAPEHVFSRLSDINRPRQGDEVRANGKSYALMFVQPLRKYPILTVQHLQRKYSTGNEGIYNVRTMEQTPKQSGSALL